MALRAALKPDSLPDLDALHGRTSFGLSRMLLSLGCLENSDWIAGALNESDEVCSGEEVSSAVRVDTKTGSCFAGACERSEMAALLCWSC